MFQSIGWRSHAWWPAISQGAKIWAVVLFLGYAAVPGAVLAGFGKDYLENVKKNAAEASAPSGDNAPELEIEEAK
jgi:hypothetical protein